jgi:hypothetical protein
MAEREIHYVRKLSGDEATHGYVMIMKESLKLFPKPKVGFKVKVNERSFDSEVKIVDCWCQGPKKPHMHYRIDLKNFRSEFRPKFGQTIQITKIEENTYELK